MRKQVPFRRGLVFLLVFCFVLSAPSGALAAPGGAAENALQKTAEYVLEY